MKHKNLQPATPDKDKLNPRRRITGGLAAAALLLSPAGCAMDNDPSSGGPAPTSAVQPSQEAPTVPEFGSQGDLESMRREAFGVIETRAPEVLDTALTTISPAERATEIGEGRSVALPESPVSVIFSPEESNSSQIVVTLIDTQADERDGKLDVHVWAEHRNQDDMTKYTIDDFRYGLSDDSIDIVTVQVVDGYVVSTAQLDSEGHVESIGRIDFSVDGNTAFDTVLDFDEKGEPNYLDTDAASEALNDFIRSLGENAGGVGSEVNRAASLGNEV